MRIKLQNTNGEMFPATKPKHQSVLFMKNFSAGRRIFSLHHLQVDNVGNEVNKFSDRKFSNEVGSFESNKYNVQLFIIKTKRKNKK